MKEIKGTEDCNRNCGSHALGLKHWFDFDSVPDEAYDNDAVKCYMDDMVAELLDKYPRLRRVDRDYVSKHPNKTIIALRCSNTDFHFCLRKHRRWTAKWGNNTITIMSKDEVMNRPWQRFWDSYNSEIVYFAK